MTMTTEAWINDRPPTEADGDRYGYVKIIPGPGHPGRVHPQDWVYVHWSFVHPNASWQHTFSWEPPADPEPDFPSTSNPLSLRLRTYEFPWDAPTEPEPEGAAMTNCHWEGPPPSPHASVKDWFDQEGSKGILQGLRISALPSRVGPSSKGPKDQLPRAESHPTEPDRIGSLEQRMSEMETLISRLIQAAVATSESKCTQP